MPQGGPPQAVNPVEQDSLITEMLAKRAFIIPKKKDGVYGENNFRRTEKDNLPVYLR